MENRTFALFVILVLLFFYVAYPDLNAYPDETALAATFKILPIATLLLAVVQTQEVDDAHAQQLKYFKYGLIFSMGGDILMHFRHQFFMVSMAVFFIAHLFYLKCFRLRPVGFEAASFCFTSGFVSFMFLLPGIKGRLLQGCVCLYASLVMATWWRTIVRWQLAPSLMNLLGAAGGLAFAVSDFIIGLDAWKFPGKVRYASCMVMVTYYLAQFLLTMSVVNYGWTFFPLEDGREKKKG